MLFIFYVYIRLWFVYEVFVYLSMHGCVYVGSLVDLCWRRKSYIGHIHVCYWLDLQLSDGKRNNINNNTVKTGYYGDEKFCQKVLLATKIWPKTFCHRNIWAHILWAQQSYLARERSKCGPSQCPSTCVYSFPPSQSLVYWRSIIQKMNRNVGSTWVPSTPKQSWFPGGSSVVHVQHELLL